MDEDQRTGDQLQLAHFRDGGEVEMLTLTETEYSDLKAKLAESRASLETKAESKPGGPVTTSECPQPPVDVMDREIEPETVELSYALIRETGEGEQDVQSIDRREHLLLTELVRVMRHGGWMDRFLWEVITNESFALNFGKQERYTADTLRPEIEKALKHPRRIAA